MTDLPEEVDFLIAGAGPTGLSLAVALRQLGKAPLLIEKRHDDANTSRAAVIHARTMEMLETLAVSDALLAQGLHVRRFHFYDRDRSLLELDFSGLDTRYPMILLCPQDRTEDVLRARLHALHGEISRDREIVGIEQSAESVSVRIRADDAVRSVRAKWLIGCDGGHSTVRQSAGIAFEGARYAQHFALADVRMNWPLSRELGTLFFSPSGLMLVVPLPGDHFRIVATADDTPELPDAAYLARLLVERGPSGAGEVPQVLWSSRFSVSHRIAEHVLHGRIMLCGDAAHVHSPAGGQGMNTGIQDAITLAPALVMAHDRGVRSALDAWARERHRVAEDVISTTDTMTRAALVKSDTARFIRNTVMQLVGHVPAITKLIAHKLAELDH